MEVGDTLTYTITLLNNSSGIGLKDVYIADSVSTRFEFSESLECSECSEAEYIETGDSAGLGHTDQFHSQVEKMLL